MRRTVLGTTISVAAILTLGMGCGENPESSAVEPSFARQDNAAAPRMRLVWVNTASWLVEAGGARILHDAYFSRPVEPVFLPGTGGGKTFVPHATDRGMTERMVAALNLGAGPLDYIVAGHTHFDHSMDIPLTAELTGAQIAGAPTMCLQAEAQGIPESQCTVVEGGEAIVVADAPSSTTTMYVIHSNHSGGATSVPHAPLELVSAPALDPPTTEGAFMIGVREDMPNGGGTRVYLIEVEGPANQTLSVVIESSGSSFDFDDPIEVGNCIAASPAAACDVVVPGLTYPSPAEAFAGAMVDAGLESVDVYIGSASDVARVAREIEILKPRFFVPNHLGALFHPIPLGMDEQFEPSAGLLELLEANDVQLVYPRQFLDAFILDANGLRPTENRQMKRQIGLSDVQEF